MLTTRCLAALIALSIAVYGVAMAGSANWHIDTFTWIVEGAFALFVLVGTSIALGPPRYLRRVERAINWIEN